MGIDAGVVMQNTHAAARFKGLAHYACTIDQCVPGLRSNDCIENAERRRFAGAIRAKQSGDTSVGRTQTDIANRSYATKMFLQVVSFDHGELTKATGRRRLERTASACRFGR